ncbi:MAG: DUF1207 domain-containing protein [Candidatus Rokubacteria bacterium]|nr:DUF1207 domain-containing protein [Candidatus Rokubacteria bacterium]
MRSIIVILLVSAVGLGASPASAAAPAATPEDAFIAGYAAALLEREFKTAAPSLSVARGVVTLDEADLAGLDRDRVVAALSGIRGVQGVTVLPARGVATPAPAGPPPAAADAVPPQVRPTGFLPSGHIFDPLLADPRWPHFYASYQKYTEGSGLDNVGSVGFGETIVLYRGDVPSGGQWETGIQAGVFSIFDLDSDSMDLLNADYFAALFASYGRAGFATMGRVFHQSSHLGDEFVLRELSSLNRVNLSYEGVDLTLSYHVLHGLIAPRYDRAVRVYAGAGYLFHRDPSSLKPWSTQAGVELQSPWAMRYSIRPVAAVDLQISEENSWSTDISVRAGLAFESVQVLDRKLALLFEYFSGHSPNGQFFRERIQYFGVGLHLFF